MSNENKAPQAEAGFDISTIDVVEGSEQGIDVTIVNPKTGLDTSLVITIKGAYSAESREIISRLLAKQRAAEKANPVRQASQGEDKNEIAGLLATLTLGWKNMLEKGVPVPFTRANAERVYSHYLVIRQQLWLAVNEASNFIKG